MTSNPWGPGLRGKGAAHRSIDHTPRPPRRSRTGEPPPSSRKVSDVQHFPKHGEKIFGWVVGGCERERGGEARLRGQARKGDERRGLGRGPRTHTHDGGLPLDDAERHCGDHGVGGPSSEARELGEERASATAAQVGPERTPRAPAGGTVDLVDEMAKLMRPTGRAQRPRRRL